MYSEKLRKKIGGTCLRSQKLSGALVESTKAKATYVSTKEKKVSTLRGPAQLSDLQGGTLCPHLSPYKWRRRQDADTPMVKFEKYSPRYTLEITPLRY